MVEFVVREPVVSNYDVADGPELGQVCMQVTCQHNQQSWIHL